MAEEAWRELPRARQDELHEEWKTNYPAEGERFDQRYRAWQQQRDKRQELASQRASARYSAALEPQVALQAGGGNAQASEEEEHKNLPQSRPRPSTKKGDASRSPLHAASIAGPSGLGGIEPEPSRRGNMILELARA